jgi:hypothetical protein
MGDIQLKMRMPSDLAAIVSVLANLWPPVLAIMRQLLCPPSPPATPPQVYPALHA